MIHEPRTETTEDARPVPSEGVACGEFHSQRTLADLRDRIGDFVARVLPEQDFVLGTYTGRPDELRIETVAPGSELEPGEIVPATALPGELAQIVPLTFAQRAIGELRCERVDPADSRLSMILQSAAIAIVNWGKVDELQQAVASQACALEAMKSAIGLFGEQDVERMCAGFLQLAMDAVLAEAGAVYLTDGGRDSPAGSLQLQHLFGIPETVLAALRFEDGAALEDGLLRSRSFLAMRDAEGLISALNPASIPEQLRSLITIRLDYEGRPQGALLLLNSSDSVVDGSNEISALQHMSLLGGALFHRVSLEREEIENRKLAAEISLAGRLQQGLLPSRAPDVENLRFAWRSDAARQVGGDYIDVTSEEDGTVHAILADVSGHGVSSALLMTTFRSGFRVLMDEGLPNDKFGMMNDAICSDVGDTGMFITAAAVSIAEDGRAISFSSAGHNPVFVYRRASDSFESLDASGPPMGLFVGVEYEGEMTTLEQGDLLVLYSDGIVEAQAEQLAGDEEDMFGEDRLRELVRRHVAEGPQQLVDLIYDAVERFAGRKVQEDDTSLLIIEAV